MNIPRRFRRGGFLGRFLFFFGVFIFLLVGGLLGYGYYSENIKPLREKVMEIDSEVISMDEYVKYLKFYGIGDVRKELRLLFSMNVEREIYEGEVIRRFAGEEGVEGGEEAHRIFEVLRDRGREAGFSDDEIYEIALKEALRDKLLEKFGEKVGGSRVHVKVEYILCSSEEEARKALSELEEKSFEDVAKEYRRDPLLEGREWVPRGIMGEEWDGVVFGMKEGDISEPIKTGRGYFIVKLLAKEERELSEEDFLILRSKMLSEWIGEHPLRFKNYLDSEKREWAIKRAL